MTPAHHMAMSAATEAGLRVEPPPYSRTNDMRLIKLVAAITALLYFWGFVLGWTAGHGLRIGLGI